MSPLLLAILFTMILGTSFLSGLFGTVGGLILIGVLLNVMPLPAAMILHGVTQLASTGWRALFWFNYVRWRAVGCYVAGAAVAFGLWSLGRFVPTKPLALFLIGAVPLLTRLAPANLKPDPENALQGGFYGAVCMLLILLTGVAGPLVDTFFLGGNLDRREIVASKAACQVFVHVMKLIYFGEIIGQQTVAPLIAGSAVIVSMMGTALAARVLEPMTNNQFRKWTNAIITATCGFYVIYGALLFGLK